jgi:hypothetical protein
MKYICGMSQREPPKKPTSVRLSSQGKALLSLIAKDLGISMSGALEIAIRQLAEQRKLR